jgi:hypothetical protein
MIMRVCAKPVATLDAKFGATEASLCEICCNLRRLLGSPALSVGADSGAGAPWRTARAAGSSATAVPLLARLRDPSPPFPGALWPRPEVIVAVFPQRQRRAVDLNEAGLRNSRARRWVIPPEKEWRGSQPVSATPVISFPVWSNGDGATKPNDRRAKSYYLARMEKRDSHECHLSHHR